MITFHSLSRIRTFFPSAKALMGCAIVSAVVGSTFGLLTAGIEKGEGRDPDSETAAMVAELQNRIRVIAQIEDQNRFMSELLKLARGKLNYRIYLIHGDIVPLAGGVSLDLETDAGVVLELDTGLDEAGNSEAKPLRIGSVVGIASEGMVTKFNNSNASAIQMVAVGTAEGVALIDTREGTISVVGPPLDE